MATNDSIGDRFKDYESCFDLSLPRRMPLIIRVDGRGFHGLKLHKPFDADFFACMVDTAKALCQEIQGAVLAYQQSDEISIVARDDMRITTDAWGDKRLSKVLSWSAATATAAFNEASKNRYGSQLYGTRQFDSRAFILPDLTEVINYLIWRQQDASRNSISMAAQASFSHSSLQGANSNEMLDRLREAGSPWESHATYYRRGTVVRKVGVPKYVEYLKDTVVRNEWQADLEIPIFTQDRGYLEMLYRSLDPKDE